MIFPRKSRTFRRGTKMLKTTYACTITFKVIREIEDGVAEDTITIRCCEEAKDAQAAYYQAKLPAEDAYNFNDLTNLTIEEINIREAE